MLGFGRPYRRDFAVFLALKHTFQSFVVGKLIGRAVTGESAFT